MWWDTEAGWWSVKLTPTALQWNKFSIIGHSMGECGHFKCLLCTMCLIFMCQLSFISFQVEILLDWWVTLSWQAVSSSYYCVPLNPCCISHSSARCILRWWMLSYCWTLWDLFLQIWYFHSFYYHNTEYDKPLKKRWSNSDSIHKDMN